MSSSSSSLSTTTAEASSPPSSLSTMQSLSSSSSSSQSSSADFSTAKLQQGEEVNQINQELSNEQQQQNNTIHNRSNDLIEISDSDSSSSSSPTPSTIQPSSSSSASSSPDPSSARPKGGQPNQINQEQSNDQQNSKIHNSSNDLIVLSDTDSDNLLTENNLETQQLNKSLVDQTNQATKQARKTWNRQLICQFCESPFLGNSRLRKHMKDAHPKEMPFYCIVPECPFLSKDAHSMGYHVSIKHEIDYDEAVNHVGSRVELEVIIPKCHKCGRLFNKPEELPSHLADHAKTGYRCTWKSCGHFYLATNSLERHITRKHLKDNSQFAKRKASQFVEVLNPDGTCRKVIKKKRRVKPKRWYQTCRKKKKSNNPKTTEKQKPVEKISIAQESTNKTETASTTVPAIRELHTRSAKNGIPMTRGIFDYLNHRNSGIKEKKLMSVNIVSNAGFRKCAPFDSMDEGIIAYENDQKYRKVKGQPIEGIHPFMYRPKDGSTVQKVPKRIMPVNVAEVPRKKKQRKLVASKPQPEPSAVASATATSSQHETTPTIQESAFTTSIFEPSSSSSSLQPTSAASLVTCTKQRDDGKVMDLMIVEEEELSLTENISNAIESSLMAQTFPLLDNLQTNNNPSVTYLTHNYVVEVPRKRMKRSNCACKHCGRNTFNDIQELTSHVEHHSTSSGFRCLKCGFFYPFGTDAQTHVVKDHFRDDSMLTGRDPMDFLVPIKAGTYLTLKRGLECVELPSATSSNAPESIVSSFEVENCLVSPQSSTTNDMNEAMSDNNSQLLMNSTSSKSIDGDELAVSENPTTEIHELASTAAIHDLNTSTCEMNPSCATPLAQASPLFDNLQTDKIAANVSSESQVTANSTSNHAALRFQCCVCIRKTFKTIQSRSYHYRKAHSELLPHHCKYSDCSYVCFKKSNCVDHIRSEHLSVDQTRVKDFIGTRSAVNCVCRHCGLTLETLSLLEAHIQAHNTSSGYRCLVNECGFFFPLCADARSHVKEHHFKDDPMMVAEQIPMSCLEAIEPRTYLAQQAELVSETPSGAPYIQKCDICAETFTNSTLKSKHYLSKHPEKLPYHCAWPACTFASFGPNFMRAHIQRDHPIGNKNAADYVRLQFVEDRTCPQCGRTMEGKKKLKIHLIAHTKSGHRCLIDGCGYFYPAKSPIARSHVKDHFRREPERFAGRKLRDFLELIKPAKQVIQVPDQTTSTYEPAPTTSTYEPAPTTSTYEPVPTTSAYEPAPTTSTYEPAPTTSAYEPAPTTSTYEPAPTTSTYEPAPTTSAYEPAPTTSTYEPAPTTSAYELNPATSAYESAPTTSRHEPDPSTSTHELNPATSAYEPAPTTSTYEPAPTIAILEPGSSNSLQFQPAATASASLVNCIEQRDDGKGELMIEEKLSFHENPYNAIETRLLEQTFPLLDDDPPANIVNAYERGEHVESNSTSSSGYLCLAKDCGLIYSFYLNAINHIEEDHKDDPAISGQDPAKSLLKVMLVTDLTHNDGLECVELPSAVSSNAPESIVSSSEVDCPARICPSMNEAMNKYFLVMDPTSNIIADGDELAVPEKVPLLDHLQTDKAMQTNVSESQITDLILNKILKYQCCICMNKRFKSFSSRCEHYRAAHSELLPRYCKWPDCSYVCFRSNKCENHIRSKHPIGGFTDADVMNCIGIRSIVNCVCKLCGLAVESINMLEKHVEAHNISASNQCRENVDVRDFIGSLANQESVPTTSNPEPNPTTSNQAPNLTTSIIEPDLTPITSPVVEQTNIVTATNGTNRSETILPVTKSSIQMLPSSCSNRVDTQLISDQTNLISTMGPSSSLNNNSQQQQQQQSIRIASPLNLYLIDKTIYVLVPAPRTSGKFTLVPVPSNVAISIVDKVHNEKNILKIVSTTALATASATNPSTQSFEQNSSQIDLPSTTYAMSDKPSQIVDEIVEPMEAELDVVATSPQSQPENLVMNRLNEDHLNDDDDDNTVEFDQSSNDNQSMGFENAMDYEESKVEEMECEETDAETEIVEEDGEMEDTNEVGMDEETDKVDEGAEMEEKEIEQVEQEANVNVVNPSASTNSSAKPITTERAHDHFCFECHHEVNDSETFLHCSLCPLTYHSWCVERANLFNKQKLAIERYNALEQKPHDEDIEKLTTETRVCDECVLKIVGKHFNRTKDGFSEEAGAFKVDIVNTFHNIANLLIITAKSWKFPGSERLFKSSKLRSKKKSQQKSTEILKEMDLKTILSKKDKYESMDEFLFDVKLIVHNRTISSEHNTDTVEQLSKLLALAREEAQHILLCDSCNRLYYGEAVENLPKESYPNTTYGPVFQMGCQNPHTVVWTKIGNKWFPAKVFRNYTECSWEVSMDLVKVVTFGPQKFQTVKPSKLYEYSSKVPENGKIVTEDQRSAVKEAQFYLDTLDSNFFDCPKRENARRYERGNLYINTKPDANQLPVADQNDATGKNIEWNCQVCGRPTVDRKFDSCTVAYCSEKCKNTFLRAKK